MKTIAVSLVTLVTAVAATGQTFAQHTASQERVRVAQQCSQRVGPFATQDTAWARWRQAQGTGYAVSGGVFPCFDASATRGYCFNVFTC
jgi:Tfp pilus assembly protein PilV